MWRMKECYYKIHVLKACLIKLSSQSKKEVNSCVETISMYLWLSISDWTIYHLYTKRCHASMTFVTSAQEHYFDYACRWICTHCAYSPWQIWVKFIVEDIHVMLLNLFDVCENQFSGSYTLFRSVINILPHFPHLFPSWMKFSAIRDLHILLLNIYQVLENWQRGGYTVLMDGNSHIIACTLKSYDIFKIKDAFVKYVYHVTEYTILSLFSKGFWLPHNILRIARFLYFVHYIYSERNTVCQRWTCFCPQSCMPNRKGCSQSL
jgi:hypothetical protein